MNSIKYAILTLLTLSVIACKKKTTPEPVDGFKLQDGLLVLCEGLFQQNNSSLSWIDTDGTVHADIFQSQVGRGLGDTGNDMITYGGKIYVAVNVSSTIEVLSAKDLTSVKQIPMFDGNTPKQPRQLAGLDQYIYVTCFDGYVDVIDTTSLNVVQRIAVGPNPEGISVSNGKVYVSNSGGLNYPDLDSTVSVIDPMSQTEIDRITVGMNPGKMIVDSDGDVYVVTRGDYGSIPSGFTRISASGVTQELGIEVSLLDNYGNDFIMVYSSAGSLHAGVFDPSTDAITVSDVIDISGIQTVYGIGYLPTLGRIAVCDAMGYVNSGKVFVYSSSGSLLNEYQVGLNPSKVWFYE
ncbi:MAG: YncE family protein [Bacteroidetes bacterium]|nr:MAG: YncE family protein [Bacteroidota bacterium]